jgi:hypothetical protein
MSDKKIIKKLNSEDTVGFGEFAEEYDEEFDTSSSKGQQRKDAVSVINHLLLRDHDRLVKLKKMLSIKLPFIRKYPNSDSIQQKMQAENTILLKHLVSNMKNQHSHFHKNFNHLWKNAFKID